MTIKIEMKPITREVEVPGYGKFIVSPLGAGAEAEIRIISRELDEKTEATKKFDSLIEREKAGEKFDKESKEYKECMEAYAEAGGVIDRLRDTYYEKLREVIKGEKVDKLFHDFTYDQIAKMYKEAVKDV